MEYCFFIEDMWSLAFGQMIVMEKILTSFNTIQFRVILKHDLGNSQNLFIRSLLALGIWLTSISSLLDIHWYLVLGVWAGKSGWMEWRSDIHLLPAGRKSSIVTNIC